MASTGNPPKLDMCLLMNSSTRDNPNTLNSCYLILGVGCTKAKGRERKRIGFCVYWFGLHKQLYRLFSNNKKQKVEAHALGYVSPNVKNKRLWVKKLRKTKSKMPPQYYKVFIYEVSLYIKAP